MLKSNATTFSLNNDTELKQTMRSTNKSIIPPSYFVMSHAREESHEMATEYPLLYDI